MKPQAFILQKVAAGDPRRIRDIARVVEALESLPYEKAYRIEPEEWKAERTEGVNAYYWSTVNKMIGQAWGFPAAEIHESMCGLHFGWVEKPCPPTPLNQKGLESVPRRTTTTDENGQRSVLKGMEFWEFIETCRQFGAERLGIYIPDPDPMYKINRERDAA